jgi:hypothetical protein
VLFVGLCVGLFVALFLSGGGTASASCEKKSQLVDSLVSRLVDLSSTSDFNQATRDRDVIREDTIGIRNQDCVNSSAELTRFSDLALSVHDDLSAVKDYYDNEEGMSSMPIEQKVFHSHESQDSVHCRCYARERALSEIFIDMNALTDVYSTAQMTHRESQAVYAWYRILDNDLASAIGIRLRSVGALNSGEVRAAYEAAVSQLRKHCNLDLNKAVAYPGNCKFTDYDTTGSTPGPSPSPRSSPSAIPSPISTHAL